MKKVLSIALITIFCVFSMAAQSIKNDFDLSDYGVSIVPDKRLIAVLTSLEVAGIETPLSSNGQAFRAEIRNDFKGLGPDLRQRMRIFVSQYQKRRPKATSSEIVAPFVTLAYSLSKAPSLKAPERSLDLPDDLLEVLDFSVLVGEFYKSPGVAAKIEGYHRKYLKLGDKLLLTAKEMVRDVLDYLHTKPQLVSFERVRIEVPGKNKKDKLQKIEIREHDRSFKIVPEVLVPKGTVNFLNIRDNYYAIVSPETDLSSSDVRRGYLQFVLDPMVLKNARAISEHQDGIKKLLDQRREEGASVSPDVFLAVSRSLVAAVDIREEQFRREVLATSQARRKIDLLKNSEEKSAVVRELDRVKSIFADEAALQLSESFEKGAVLAFYFSQKLVGIEDSGFDIANSLKDWIATIDTKTEESRLAENVEARNRAVAERERRRNKTVVETTLVTNPLTEKLLEIDKDIEAKQLEKAEKSLNLLLREYPSGAPRIYYSLGRVVSRSAEGLNNTTEINRRLIKAKTYFEKGLNASTNDTDRELISLTYVSLGRIYEFYDQKDYAVKIYETAMQFGSVEGEGYRKAFEAKRKLISKN